MLHFAARKEHLDTVIRPALDAGEWVIRFGDPGFEWSHAHEKGDVAVRGPVSDLYLLMWGRAPLDDLESFGDAGVVARWRSATAV